MILLLWVSDGTCNFVMSLEFHYQSIERHFVAMIRNSRFYRHLPKQPEAVSAKREEQISLNNHVDGRKDSAFTSDFEPLLAEELKSYVYDYKKIDCYLR
ncbi:hypothetical protein D918_06502 [Trichuris suis]|nr:hypothetical protein D918_06502 [Trichuris suis]